MITKLTDGIVLYAASMGKVFRVTHVCPNMESANKVLEKDRDTACIAEDNNGFIYLAEQYGSVAPSAILRDLKSKRAKPAATDPPQTIFLQWHGDSDECETGPVSEPDVTWARDRIFDRDVEYLKVTP